MAPASAAIAMTPAAMMIAVTRPGPCGRVDHDAIAFPVSTHRNAIHSETIIGNAHSVRLLTLSAANTSVAMTMNPSVRTASPTVARRGGIKTDRGAPQPGAASRRSPRHRERWTRVARLKSRTDGNRTISVPYSFGADSSSRSTFDTPALAHAWRALDVNGLRPTTSRATSSRERMAARRGGRGRHRRGAATLGHRHGRPAGLLRARSSSARVKHRASLTSTPHPRSFASSPTRVRRRRHFCTRHDASGLTGTQTYLCDTLYAAAGEGWGNAEDKLWFADVRVACRRGSPAGASDERSSIERLPGRIHIG